MTVAIISIITICVIILIILIISYITFRLTFYNSNRAKQKLMNPKAPLLGDDYAKYQDSIFDAVDRVFSVPYEDVYTNSYDGLRLHGRYYHNGDGLPIEIFFHGYRSPGLRDGSGSIELAQKAHYNLLVVDQRANGLSDGNVITFGVKEKHDVLSWAEYVTRRFGDNCTIILAGVSMGAATVLMASALELPSNVKCITADCGYSSQAEIIKKVCKDLKFPSWMVMPFIRLGAKVYGGFDLYSETPMDAVKKASVPIIFFHGDNDNFVPCEMSKSMYESCMSNKDIFIAEGAAHGVSYIEQGDQYRSHLAKFFRDNGITVTLKDNF